MHNTQLPSFIPPHDTTQKIKTITIKDVSNPLTHNINHLTIEDLKKILDQSTLQEKLFGNPILVSMEELQKVVIDVTREKVNPQEPPSIIPSVTNVQSLVQMLEIRSTKTDTIVKVISIDKKVEEKDTIVGQHKEIGQIDSSCGI